MRRSGSGISERRRIFLIAGGSVLALAIVYGTILGLYRAAVVDKRGHLAAIAQNRAEVAEAIGRGNVTEYGMGAEATMATLRQIEEARTQCEDVGQTGELTIAHGDRDQIVFLFVHRHANLDLPPPVPADSDSAEAMRRAVNGASGTMIGVDDLGRRVLAAYEPIPVFGWGLVAQIDLAEVGAPFRDAAWVSGVVLVFVTALGVYVSTRITRPMRRRIDESERRYHELVEAMSDGWAVQDKDQRVIYVNDRYCEILGRDRRELIGHPADIYMTEESREGFRHRMTQLRERGAGSYESTFARPDGSHVHVLTALRPTLGPKGEYEGSVAVHSEVTAQQHGDICLRREKDRTQQYLDIAGVMIVALNRHGQIDLINRSGLAVLGYDSDEELLGKDWFSTCLPERRRDQVRSFFNQLMVGQAEPLEVHESAVITKGGRERLITWRNTVLRDSRGVITGTLSSGSDVTERRETELRSRLAAEVSSDLIYEWDVHTDELRWFGDLDSALGYGPGEIPQTIEAWIGLIHPDDVKRLGAAVNLHRTGIRPIHEEYRVRHRDGSWRHWIDRATPVLDDSGLPRRWIGACVDITDRVRVEETLQEKETQYRSIFESTTDAVLIIDMEGKIVAANPLAFEMYGYSEEELIGLSSSRIIHPDYFHGFKNFKQRVNEGKRFYVDSVNLRKDGTEFDIEMHGAGFTYRGEPHLLSVVRDITERKQAEIALQQAREKIERLHEIASQLEACESEDDVYRATVVAAEKILSFSMCTLDIVEGQRLVIKATSSELPPDASRESELAEGGLAADTHRTGETTVFGSLDEVPQATPSRGDLLSGISAPIGDFGVFQVASTGANAFGQEDVRLLELLLGHTAEAINRIRLRERLKEQALHDSLTGVYNRRYFNQVIEQEIPRSTRYAHPIGFLMIDVNHFKEINDRYGHQVGDEVLQEVAKLLQQHVRESDVVVRYGGDEFLLVLIETNGETKKVKQRILEEVARRNETNPVFDFPVTFSIGTAHWSPDGPQTVNEVLAEADMRMYEEKRHRRQAFGAQEQQEA